MKISFVFVFSSSLLFTFACISCSFWLHCSVWHVIIYAMTIAIAQQRCLSLPLSLIFPHYDVRVFFVQTIALISAGATRKKLKRINTHTQVLHLELDCIRFARVTFIFPKWKKHVWKEKGKRTKANNTERTSAAKTARAEKNLLKMDNRK